MTDVVAKIIKRSLPKEFFEIDNSIEVIDPITAVKKYFSTLVDVAAVVYQIAIQNHLNDEPFEIAFAKYFPTFSRIVFTIDFMINPKTSRDIDFEDFVVLFYTYVDLSIAFDLSAVYSQEHIDKFVYELSQLKEIKND